MEDFVVGGYIPNTSIQITFEHVLWLVATGAIVILCRSIVRRFLRQQKDNNPATA